jgi:hypothetical protein
VPACPGCVHGCRVVGVVDEVVFVEPIGFLADPQELISDDTARTRRANSAALTGPAAGAGGFRFRMLPELLDDIGEGLHPDGTVDDVCRVAGVDRNRLPGRVVCGPTTGRAVWSAAFG